MPPSGFCTGTGAMVDAINSIKNASVDTICELKEESVVDLVCGLAKIIAHRLEMGDFTDYYNLISNEVNRIEKIINAQAKGEK